ncbi:AF4/FMR2 family member 4 [Drosophila busckii]|uniref:AF4/FMR2 family member 4 n=1 Tax=Drosophila busckii TaxID=30019 RepID=UPI001432AFEC|nr:AF4/FMR2 family member 4 [Drosophila busckii]
MANCLRYAVRIIANNAAAADGDDDDVAAVVYEKCVEQVNAMAAGPDHDVNAANIRTTHAANDEVSTAREQQQQQQQQPAHSSSSSLQKRNRCLTTTSRIMLLPATATGKSGWPALMTLLIALLLSMRLAAAGTCWQTQQSHDKCSNLYSTNITKLECCGASQTFSYTDRELSNVEHFFATAIGGGVECAPCMESCKSFKCGANKKCVKRKGRPKCVCAPECGATLRRKQRQQQQQQQLEKAAMALRGSRSLSSEIINTNLDLDGAKRQHKNNNNNGADNQRTQQQQQQQQQQQLQPMPKRASHRKQGETKHRRLLIIDNSNLQEQPTTRRLHLKGGGRVKMQLTPLASNSNSNSNERRRHRKINSSSSNNNEYSNNNNNGKHLTRSMTTLTLATGANDSSTPAQTLAQSRHNLANANEPANNINRQSEQSQQQQDNAKARLRHQQQQQQQQHAPNHAQQYDNGSEQQQQQQQRRRKHKHNHKDQRTAAAVAAATLLTENTTMSVSGSRSESGAHQRLLLTEHGSATAASSGHLANVDDLAYLPGIYEPAAATLQQQQQHINPVCGNDGRTYNTECQLRKRACRTNNAQLEVAYRGHCKTSCHGVQCLNGLICVEDQNMMPHCIACQINCPWDDQAVELAEEHAVCGVDGQTYRSICDINRMICQIGRSIAVAYPGPCRADRVTCANIKCGPKDTCLLDLQTQLPRCVSCRYKCARKQQRSPYNVDKICGNNNHTYNSYCEMRKDSCATGYYIGVRSTGVC